MNLPRDDNRNSIPLVSATPAKQVTRSSSLASAVDITLNSGTSLIEVNALAQGVYLRYASTASAAAFDEFIQAGSVRHYVKPNGVTVISLIEQTPGATVIVIEK